MQELLCESKWTIEDLGSFTFTEDNKVIKKKGSTETGTYEVTDDDILIMHFKKRRSELSVGNQFRWNRKMGTQL